MEISRKDWPARRKGHFINTQPFITISVANSGINIVIEYYRSVGRIHVQALTPGSIDIPVASKEQGAAIRSAIFATLINL